MTTTPYTPPGSNNANENATGRSPGRWLAGIGIALFTGPVWGMVGSLIGMSRAFRTLADTGAASPTDLVREIEVAIGAAMIGVGVGFLGAVLILAALFSAKNRDPWFFWWTISVSIVLSVFTFPYGLVLGLPMALVFASKRAEFAKPTMA